MDEHKRNLGDVDSIFRSLTREVWIVTSASGERRGGLLSTWFSPASLDPARPLVVAALAPIHFTRELVDASGSFAAHLLAREHVDLAWNFGLDSGRSRDKFTGVPHRQGVTGSPVLEGVLAWLECRVLHRLTGGDRIYYWAEVVAAGKTSSVSPPLTDRDLFAAATPEQRERLKANLNADVSALRAFVHQPWRLDEPS